MKISEFKRKKNTNASTFLEKMKYPAFEKLPDVEDFHGEKIPDPYKWLEEPDSEKTKV